MKPDRWQRLLPLLDQALQVEDDGRHRFLDALDSPDQELRPDLERLLAEHDRQGSRTAPNAMELAAPAFADQLEEDAELDQGRVGERIGAYRLVSLLGTGGMGAVYLAERTEHGFTQVVALKLVRKSLGRIASERFERERQILAGLKHPGIAQLFDGGKTAEGRSFYTMEYVEGEPITDYCEGRALAPKERVRLLLEVVTTLSYAHQNLVVHRDIKPSNVLVTREGRVKLIDFGLAKLLDEHAMPSVTQTGLGPMTPVYAAPEQFHSKPTTVATDIYQFGVLSFLVFTGGLPYRTDPHDSLEWAHAVCEEEPVTLMSAADAAKSASSAASASLPFSRVRHRLSKDLDAIVRKCLAKLPERRYRSADALISDLEAFLADRPVTARPAGPLYFAWRFVQRRRYAVATSALALLVLATAASVALQQFRSAAAYAERAAYEAEIRDVTREMLTNLLRAGPASAAAQRPGSTLEALDQGVEQTFNAVGSNLKHRAMAVAVLGQSYLDTQHPQRASELVQREMARLSSLDDTQMLDLHLILARAAAELGETETSERSLETADRMIARLALPTAATQRLASALISVRLKRHAGREEKAGDMLRTLLHNFDRPGTNESLEFADLLRLSARTSTDEDVGSALFERAKQIASKRYGLNSPVALQDERDAIARDMQGSHKLDTEGLLRAQEAHVRDAFGEESIDYADLLDLRCASAYFARRYDESVSCWKKVLSVYERAPDAETLIAVTCGNIANGYLKLAQPAQALPYFERELAVRSRNYAPTERNVIDSRLQVARTRCLIGDIDSASREWDDAIHAYIALGGPSYPVEAVHAARFATCLLDAGRIESARSMMERHGKLDPTKDMTKQDRADVLAVWKRLSRPL